MPTRRLPRGRVGLGGDRRLLRLLVVTARARRAGVVRAHNAQWSMASIQAAVTCVAGQHGAFCGPMPRSTVRFWRSYCETWRRCICSGRPRTHRAPGRRARRRSWQGEVDLGVRVCLGMGRPGNLELSDLAVQFGDDLRGGAGRDAEGPRGDRGRGGRCSDRRAISDFAGTGSDIALPAPRLSPGLDCGYGEQCRALLGGRKPPSAPGRRRRAR